MRFFSLVIEVGLIMAVGAGDTGGKRCEYQARMS